MASKFFPTVDHPAVQENLHLFRLDPTWDSLCGIKGLFTKYSCIDCPFGENSTHCSLNRHYNAHLPLFLTQLRLAHPELFI